MSFYADMFRAGGNFRSYLMHINRFGEIAIYALNEDGKPQSMVQGNAMASFNSVFRGDGLWFRVVRPEGMFDDKNLIAVPFLQPRHFRLYGGRTWEAFARHISGNGIKARCERAEYGVYERLFGLKYIDWDDKGKYVASEEGIKADCWWEAKEKESAKG